MAMVADARSRLDAWGQPVAAKVFLTGFSASGMFVTRFAMLHPTAVRAVAAGGLNSYVILPVAALQGETLAFHLGVADINRYTGQAFEAAAWRKLPQHLFMGSTDTNDAVLYDDAYSPSERDLVFRLVGREMPRRWEACRQIYARAGASAVFVTYPELGHGTNRRVHDDVAAFLASHAKQDDA
jgi:pimeloyl-ACP methyl ester carboxylesterase